MYDKNGAVATDQTTEFDHTFTITDITLQGDFATSGTMDLSAENPSWNSTLAAATYDMTATAGQALTGEYFNFSTDNYLMVLPTNFTSKAATLTVKYKITYAGATSDEITKTLPINTNFEQGKAYTINLTLQRNEDNAISFENATIDQFNGSIQNEEQEDSAHRGRCMRAGGAGCCAGAHADQAARSRSHCSAYSRSYR